MFIVKLLLTVAWLAALVAWGVGDLRFWLVLALVLWWFPGQKPKKRCPTCGK